FRFAAVTIAAAMAAGAAVVFLLAPRLADVWPALPHALWLALGAASGITWLWFGVLLLSFYGRARLLPEGWLERGPYLRLMSLTSLVARPFGKRDWVEHAAIDVYNALPGRHARPGHDGAVGEDLGGVVATCQRPDAGVPNRCFNFSISPCATL